MLKMGMYEFIKQHNFAIKQKKNNRRGKTHIATLPCLINQGIYRSGSWIGSLRSRYSVHFSLNVELMRVLSFSLWDTVSRPPQELHRLSARLKWLPTSQSEPWRRPAGSSRRESPSRGWFVSRQSEGVRCFWVLGLSFNRESLTHWPLPLCAKFYRMECPRAFCWLDCHGGDQLCRVDLLGLYFQ